MKTLKNMLIFCYCHQHEVTPQNIRNMCMKGMEMQFQMWQRQRKKEFREASACITICHLASWLKGRS